MSDVIIACDKFKGSLSAHEVIDAIRRGIVSARPHTDVAAILVADGGDGTLAAAEAAGFTRHEITVSGPTLRPVQTAYAVRGNQALVEMADACGLGRLPMGELRGLDASSRGLGEAMRAALDSGCEELVVGIGGSASTDGGAGMLQSLGARLLNDDGTDVGPGARGLERVARVDLSGLDPRLATTRLTIACDVNNPLLGDAGAAAVFGPQKGIDPAEFPLAEAGLTRLANVCAEAFGRDESAQPGAGAAGGVGYMLLMLGASFKPGIDIVLGLSRFAEWVRGARLVITGEGRLDEQTLLGKTPAGVTAAATAAGVPVVAVCGSALLSEERARELGFRALYTLSEIEPDVGRSMANAAPLLRQVAARISREQLG